MKINEIYLFNVNEPVSDEFLRIWKSASSKVINGIRSAIENDVYLCDKIAELTIEWKYDKRSGSPFFAHIDRQSGKTEKHLVVNIPVLEEIADIDVDSPFQLCKLPELLFQLYKLPGEEQNTHRLPIVQKQLEKWVERLGDDFFTLYPSYHSQLRAAGIQLALVKNHPELKQKIFDLYLIILDMGHIPRTLYDFGDIGIETQERGLPRRTSLFGQGAYKLLINHRDDYLTHYVVGIPIVTMSAAFSLANSDVASEMGRELKERIERHYRSGSNPLVYERLTEHAKLVRRNTFDEYYYPSLKKEGDYIPLVEKYLGDCFDIRKLMQHSTHSLIESGRSDPRYELQRFDLLNAIRNQSYVE